MVPSHWQVHSLKLRAAVMPSNVDKKARDDEQTVRLCNYTDVYYNDTITDELPFMAATASDDQITRFSLRAGDVIITKDSETADDIAVSALVPQDLPGVVCGYHLALLRPREGTRGEFMKYLFDAASTKAAVATRANGLTRVGLSQYALDSLELPFPTISEQVAIAAFLDRETAKIDALIAEQERLIALLDEKRQAVITQAVTKGLDPSVPMKDSGVEWIGPIPSHWKMPRLDSRFDIVLGKMLDEKRIEGASLHRYLRNVDVQWDCINTDALPTMDIYPEEAERYLLRRGDLLICEGGEVGRAAIWEGDDLAVGFQKALHRARPRIHTESSRFFFYQLRDASARGVFEANGNPNTILHLTGQQLRAYRFPCPPSSEQEEIAAYLDSMNREVNSVVNAVTRALELLRERRSALISAAVTGQIDVRCSVDAEAA
jgi:type I restriction enzyme S subunit